MKKKGFTLIELIAVLVIMAILALIVTPLVMSIIRKVRVSADKRSVDAYGRSIELAITGYLLDNGTFPTSIEQLTIEYSGDEVVCEQEQLNADSSIYLAGCRVGGRSVEGYTYGMKETKPYTVGDEVTYNGVDYYVINDSSASEETVTLLKAEPLSVAEVNQFGAGHINMNVSPSESYYQTAYSSGAYGGMQYYSSPTCGYVNNNWVYDGCTTDYESSEIKYVVDAWKNAKAPAAREARLISKDEIDSNFEFEHYKPCGDECGIEKDIITTEWMYNNNYWYWTNTPHNDSSFRVWGIKNLGDMDYSNVILSNGVVRPVIVLPKSVL